MTFKNVRSVDICRKKCESLEDKEKGIEVPFFTFRGPKSLIEENQNTCSCKSAKTLTTEKQPGVHSGRTHCCAMEIEYEWDGMVTKIEHYYAQCENGECVESMEKGRYPEGGCGNSDAVMAKQCPVIHNSPEL